MLQDIISCFVLAFLSFASPLVKNKDFSNSLSLRRSWTRLRQTRTGTFQIASSKFSQITPTTGKTTPSLWSTYGWKCSQSRRTGAVFLKPWTLWTTWVKMELQESFKKSKMTFIKLELCKISLSAKMASIAVKEVSLKSISICFFINFLLRFFYFFYSAWQI